jgi:diketogulonate reductase-like aldo/keto reductase
MAYAKTKFKLNTGAEIPAVGFGTWQDKDAQEDAVYEALIAGYRHIDTARVYAVLRPFSADMCGLTEISDMAQNQLSREASKRVAYPVKTSSSSPSYGTTITTLMMLKRRAICR